jgi:hypothetical protein
MERTDEDTQPVAGLDEEAREEAIRHETGPIELRYSDGEALQRFEG